MQSNSCQGEPVGEQRLEAAQAQLEFRDLKEQDLDQACGLSRNEGWPHRLEDWQFMLSLGQGRAVVSGDRLLATAMVWQFGERLASLGMVLVHPDWRGQGLGRQLVQQLLVRANAERIVLHATERARPLYSSLGFRPVGEILQLQGRFNGRTDAVSSDLDVGRRLDRENLSRLAAFDQQAACGNRQHLLERLLARGEGRLLFSGSDLQGYAMLRRFGWGLQIGPAVATHEDHALALVMALSHDLDGKFLRLDVVRDSRLADWALQQGLLHVASVTRMVLGPASGSRPADGPRLHALASQALG